MDKQKCQDVYLNLLKYHDDSRRDENGPYYFFNKLLLTVECDQFHDLSDLRIRYTSYIKSIYSTNRIQNNQNNEANEIFRRLVCTSAVFFYYPSTHRMLLKSLNFRTKLRYVWNRLFKSK